MIFFFAFIAHTSATVKRDNGSISIRRDSFSSCAINLTQCLRGKIYANVVRSVLYRYVDNAIDNHILINRRERVFM